MIPIELLAGVRIVTCALFDLFGCVVIVFPNFPFMCLLDGEFSEAGKEVMGE